jgi:hypothetical protein
MACADALASACGRRRQSYRIHRDGSPKGYMALNKMDAAIFHFLERRDIGRSFAYSWRHIPASHSFCFST